MPQVQDWTLIVDGLFGIGLQRDLSGDYAALIDYINSLDAPVLALDIPSGLDADSGRVLGCAIAADHTITFIALKPGLLTLDGPDHCGTQLALRFCRKASVPSAPSGPSAAREKTCAASATSSEGG